MRFGRHPRDMGDQLERAVSGAPVAVGGGGGICGLRSSRLLRQRVLQCLGSCIRIEEAERLFAMIHGARAEFGQCLVNGTAVRFDVWVPHEGIAIDYQPRTEEEVDAKSRWCEERRALYAYIGPTAGPTATTMADDAVFDQLQSLIHQRRERLHG